MSMGILFLRFAYIGLMAFGGGLACIPFLSRLVDELPFMTQNDLANIVALAEMTPGAVGVNMATYTGFMIAGVVGGIVATAGLILPSVLIVGCLSRLWERTKRLPVVLSVFAAVKAAVAGLLMSIAVSLFLIAFQVQGTFVWDLRRGALMVVLGVVVWRYQPNPIVYLTAFAGLGILLGL